MGNGMLASHSCGLCEDKSCLMLGGHEGKGNRVSVAAVHAWGLGAVSRGRHTRGILCHFC